VTILCLPPHTTHKLQPLDVSFMYPLNHYHDKALEKWLTNNPGRVVTVFQISHIFNESYMQACTPLNAINGFKKTGIFPYNPDVFTDIDFAAAEVTEQNEPQNDTVHKENDAVQEHNEEVNDENNAVQEQNDEANKKSIESNEQNYTNESCETTQNQNIQEKAVEDAPEIIDAVVHNSPTPGPSTKPDSPPTIAETSFPQNEGESSLSASSFSAAAPSMCHPLPKIKGRRSQRKRKSVGTVLLTSTPYKNMLEEEKRAKNALEYRKKAKGKAKIVQKNAKTKKNTKKTIEQDNDETSDESNESDAACLYCTEKYVNSSKGEGWIRCTKCLQWAHDECAGVEENENDLCLSQTKLFSVKKNIIF
jgi:hypothetical protein